MIQLLYICVMPPSNHHYHNIISNSLLLQILQIQWLKNWNAIILDVEFEPQVF